MIVVRSNSHISISCVIRAEGGGGGGDEEEERGGGGDCEEEEEQREERRVRLVSLQLFNDICSFFSRVIKL